MLDFRVDVIFLGTILFGRLACQPAQRAEEPAIFILVGLRKKNWVFGGWAAMNDYFHKGKSRTHKFQ